jgi:haloalkane dehalogenase
MKDSPFPKLWIQGDPGMIVTPQLAEFCGSWPNQTHVKQSKAGTSSKRDSPDEIGEAVATFVRGLRSPV